jgi:hypothetical protein
MARTTLGQVILNGLMTWPMLGLLPLHLVVAGTIYSADRRAGAGDALLGNWLPGSILAQMAVTL